MKTHQFTCVTCPVGCELTVTVDGDKVEVSGNKCKRGKTYGENEATHPVRTLTTTVFVPEAGRMLPVRSDKPVPKENLKEYVKIIKNTKIHLPISVGCVIIENIDGNGSNIVAAGECIIQE